MAKAKKNEQAVVHRYMTDEDRRASIAKAAVDASRFSDKSPMEILLHQLRTDQKTRELFTKPWLKSIATAALNYHAPTHRRQKKAIFAMGPEEETASGQVIDFTPKAKKKPKKRNPLAPFEAMEEGAKNWMKATLIDGNLLQDANAIALRTESKALVSVSETAAKRALMYRLLAELIETSENAKRVSDVADHSSIAQLELSIEVNIDDKLEGLMPTKEITSNE